MDIGLLPIGYMSGSRYLDPLIPALPFGTHYYFPKSYNWAEQNCTVSKQRSRNKKQKTKTGQLFCAEHSNVYPIWHYL